MTMNPAEARHADLADLYEASPPFHSLAAPAVLNDGGANGESAALDELARHQQDIERALAALHKAQPDLIACEGASASEPDARRRSWSPALAIWTSTLLLLSVAWAIRELI